MQRFEPVLFLFAAILLFSSFKLLTAGDDEEEEDLSENAIVKFCKQVHSHCLTSISTQPLSNRILGTAVLCHPSVPSPATSLCAQFIPSTDAYDGNNFFTTLSDGARVATPLLLALAVIEIGDVVFAVDSIPAIFGITRDPVREGHFQSSHAWKFYCLKKYLIHHPLLVHPSTLCAVHSLYFKHVCYPVPACSLCLCLHRHD